MTQCAQRTEVQAASNEIYPCIREDPQIAGKYVEVQDQQHKWMYFFQLCRKNSGEFFFGSQGHNYD